MSNNYVNVYKCICEPSDAKLSTCHIFAKASSEPSCPTKGYRSLKGKITSSKPSLEKMPLNDHADVSSAELCVLYSLRIFHLRLSLCLRAGKALTRLRKCAVSSEPSLVAFAISTSYQNLIIFAYLSDNFSFL